MSPLASVCLSLSWDGNGSDLPRLCEKEGDGARKVLSSGPGTEQAPSKWEPVLVSLSMIIITHGALWLAATPRPESRPALEEEFGELHFRVERGTDFTRDCPGRGCSLSFEPRIQRSPESPQHGWRQLLLQETGGMWQKSVGCPSWDQGDPPFLGRLQAGAWILRGLKDRDLGGRGQSDPIHLLDGGMWPKAFSPFMFDPCPS